MKERGFQQQVKKQLQKQAAFIINIHGHGMQIRGLPDLFIIHRKWKGFLELKVGKNKCTVIQRIVAAKIELKNMPIYVLRCVEQEGFCGGNNYGIYYVYTLENFQNEVIKTFWDIKLLLGFLIEITKNRGVE